MCVSSASKVSPSSGVAKYPRARPQSAIVPATREIICLTERSRAGESSWPRKYFWETMFVAFCDHAAVADLRVAQLPLDGVERVHPRTRELPGDGQRLTGLEVVCECRLGGGF